MSMTGRGTTAGTRSTRRSCGASAGHRDASGRTGSARRSTGTGRTASGGRRSSAPTGSASSTSGSTPRGSRELTVLLRLGAQSVDRRLPSFDRLRLVEQVEHTRAVAEVVARVREVVLGIGLVDDSRSAELAYGLLEER